MSKDDKHKLLKLPNSHITISVSNDYNEEIRKLNLLDESKLCRCGEPSDLESGLCLFCYVFENRN